MWFVSVSGMKPIQKLTVQLHVQPARNHQDGFGDKMQPMLKGRRLFLTIVGGRR